MLGSRIFILLHVSESQQGSALGPCHDASRLMLDWTWASFLVGIGFSRLAVSFFLRIGAAAPYRRAQLCWPRNTTGRAIMALRLRCPGLLPRKSSCRMECKRGIAGMPPLSKSVPGARERERRRSHVGFGGLRAPVCLRICDNAYDDALAMPASASLLAVHRPAAMPGTLRRPSSLAAKGA